MDIIYETAFEEWVERRRPSADDQIRVLEFLAEFADGHVRLTDLVQVPRSAAFQAQIPTDDGTILLEILVGDPDWCVVSFLGSG